MDWTCAQSEERLSDFLEGMLTADEQAEFSRHAAVCVQCSRLVSQVGGLLRRVHVLEPVPAPSQLVSRILDATLGPRRAPRTEKRTFLESLSLLWQPRFAMGAVTVLATAFIVLNTFAGSPRTLRRVSDLSPVGFFQSVDRHAHLVYARGVKFVNDLRVVYEIESRLRPESETPPSNEDQRKSQGAPHTGRSANRGSIVVAFALTPSVGRKLP